MNKNRFNTFLPIILIIICSFNILNAQNDTGELRLTIRLLDANRSAMPNVDIMLIETQTGERMIQKTNTIGVANFTITSGNLWSINFLDITNYDVVEFRPSYFGNQSKTCIYDLKLHAERNRTIPSREGITLDLVDQTLLFNTKPSATEAIVKIYFNKPNKLPLANYPVAVVCIKNKKLYKSITNSSGIVIFKLPITNDYEVDIGDLKSFKHFEIPSKPQQYLTFGYTYQPTTINETILNDTIRQMLPVNMSQGTTERVFYSMKVLNSEGNPWKNEPVYLNVIGEKTVYTANTNSNGEAKFLLPIGKKYMIHFKYQHNVDVINLSLIKGIGGFNGQFQYNPKEKFKNPDMYIPTPEELLIQEFENFITKQLLPPNNNEAVGMWLQWGNTKINNQSKEAILQIGFSSPIETDFSKAPPVNVCFVIDKSGSMAGYERIDKVKMATIDFINTLRENKDIVSLITFDTQGNIIIPAQKITDKNKLQYNISKIEAGGGTNIYNGLILGYKQVVEFFNKTYTNRVVLLTDGYGEDRVQTTLDMSKTYNDMGIECSVVGVGEDYNYALLSQLASKSGGLIHFVDSAQKIPQAFTKELASMLYPIATNLRLEIEFNKQLVFSQLYGYEAKTSDNKVTVKLKNMYSGLNQIALVKFLIYSPNKAIENQPIIIRLKYYDLSLKKQVEIEKKCNLEWTEEVGKFELIKEQHQKKLYAIAIMNQTLKAMAEAYIEGNYEHAKQVLQTTITDVMNLYPASSDADVASLMKQLEIYLERFKRL